MANETWGKEWGRRLRLRRLTLDLTQEQLAAAIGKHQTTISDWEKGGTTPNDFDKVLLVEALGATFEDLFPWPDISTRKRRRQVA